MEIILGEMAGFCPGVENAVKRTQKEVEEKKDIYCLGELVHNKQVVDKLKEKGLQQIEQIEEAPEKARVIIRAHGVPREVYQYAKEKQIELIDLTCAKVLGLHKMVEEYAKRGYYIILMGQPQHPENIGTISFAKENAFILQEKEEIDLLVQQIKKSGVNQIAIFSQTTFSIEKFEEYKKIIQQKIDFTAEIEIKNTICNATRLRQEETKEMANQVELMIIIGGKNSSNTTKLYEIALRGCNNAMHVETEEDLYMNYIRRFKKIGVMAGASTSKESIDRIMEILKRG